MRRAFVAFCLGTMLAACGGGAGTPRPAGGGTDRPQLFLAGDGELWVVDVTTRHVRHRRLPQLVGGDPPVRVLRRGDGLALWGYDVWRLDARRPWRPLRRIARRGSFFLPSARPDRLWVALPREGRPATLRAVREVTIDGEVTVPDVWPAGGHWPQAVVADGLLLWSGRDWMLWSPAQRRVLRRWPARIGPPGPAAGSLLASSPGRGSIVLLTDTRTGAQRRVAAPPGDVFRLGEAAFSPSGRWLAVPVQRWGPEEHPVRLALVDATRARLRVVAGAQVPAGYTFARWSRTGRDVFLTGGERFHRRVIVAYRLGAPFAHRLPVRVGDFYDVAAY